MVDFSSPDDITFRSPLRAGQICWVRSARGENLQLNKCIKHPQLNNLLIPKMLIFMSPARLLAWSSESHTLSASSSRPQLDRVSPKSTAEGIAINWRRMTSRRMSAARSSALAMPSRSAISRYLCWQLESRRRHACRVEVGASALKITKKRRAAAHLSAFFAFFLRLLHDHLISPPF